MRIGDLGNFNAFNVGDDLNLAESLLQAILPQTNNGAAAAGGGEELAPGQERTIPNDDSMPDYNQGKTNGCGTTSLAMIMSYLGVPESQGDIDSAIRRADVFTSPTDILDFARS